MTLRIRAIHAGRALLRCIGIEAKRYTPLAMACDVLTRNGANLTFVQVGANDGTSFDDFFEVATRNKMFGVAVEPLPRYFEALQRAYDRHPRVTPLRAALHPTDKTATIYSVKPDKCVHEWHHGIASFFRENVLGALDVAPDALEITEVPCMTLSEVIAQHIVGGKIDVLAVDTEGFDAEIIKMIDWTEQAPKVIRFEHKHLNRGEYAAIKGKLLGAGYQIHETWEDCTAVRPELLNRFRYLRTMLAA